MSKKAATKPPDNETKGSKAPFAKPRKAPTARKKLEGWTRRNVGARLLAAQAVDVGAEGTTVGAAGE
jgi:hypothetical protein